MHDIDRVHCPAPVGVRRGAEHNVPIDIQPSHSLGVSSAN